jgi:16S rRNA (uracil1498-N3)-methyltransferase
MPKERHYVPKEFILDQEVYIDGPEFHHLITVMRTKHGELIELVNGRGDYAIAELTQIQKKQASLSIKSLSKTVTAPTQIVLAQAIPRHNRLDFIIEKGTELGMTNLWLFPGQHSEKKEISPTQMERLNHIAISAMKQCGRLFLPEIVVLPSLTKWEAPQLPLFFGSFAPNAPLFLDHLQKRPAQSSIFCIGPESGFSSSEEKLLENLGGTGVKLHTNILRTETAAITALVLMTHKL